MLFQRNVNKFLLDWKRKENRKPLVVKGARQVGKTFAIKAFAEKEFKSCIYINLDKSDNLSLFDRISPIQEVIQMVELKYNQRVTSGDTIIFFDEIQNSPVAMSQLRYFYEEMPSLHIIAAGSLLEIKMKREGFSFPVGRVEYCYMFPVTFDEFLMALNENELSGYIENITINSQIPDGIHEMLMKKFREYVLVGGMPEAVAQYSIRKSFLDVDPVYESILTGFKNDVYKYARDAKTKYLQYVIEHASRYVGLPVKYERFGGSSFKSREMSDAFDTLEKSMIINRVYPVSTNKIPLMHNLKKSPKLVFLDVGLINYQMGFRTDIMNVEDLNVVFNGQISEQIVGQTLLALNHSTNQRLAFWYRDRKGSTSEIDYLIVYGNNKVIPLEVKSGKTGKLKSLHVFMEEGGNDIAVRVHSGNLCVDALYTSSGNEFTLISVPFYLLHRIKELLDGYFPQKK